MAKSFDALVKRTTTLGKIVEALGGELELVARFPSRKVKIAQFGKRSGTRGNRRRRSSQP